MGMDSGTLGDQRIEPVGLDTKRVGRSGEAEAVTRLGHRQRHPRDRGKRVRREASFAV